MVVEGEGERERETDGLFMNQFRIYV